MQQGELIRVGNSFLKQGEQVLEMKDSTHLLDRIDDLKQVMDKDGYVLLRGLIDPSQVLKGREAIIKVLQEGWDSIDTTHNVMDAYIKDGKKGMLLTGYKALTHHPDVSNVLEGKAISSFFRKYFGLAPATFNVKWVRIHGKGEFTDEHTDFYRFQHSAQRMCTCWVPFGEYTPMQGTLVVCEGSHVLSSLDEPQEDKKTELPRDFAEFNKTAIWRTTTFKPGDAVVFNIKLIHASTENTSDRFRMSMDTRWQPSCDVKPQMRKEFITF